MPLSSKGWTEPVELYWECPECEKRVEETPCPYCGCQEVESVWSDGVRVEAASQVPSGVELP